jgi:uncharacterized membrane protein
MERKPLSSKVKRGIWLLAAGIVFAFSPIPLAYFTTAPGHNWMSEGDSQSGGSYMWAMIITLPLGLVTALVGLVTLILAMIQQNAESKGASGSRGQGIVLIVAGCIVALPFSPMIFSLIGAVLFIAGGALVYSGIRLLKKDKG